MNLYAYAGNNPISFSDPFGLQECGSHEWQLKSGKCQAVVSGSPPLVVPAGVLVRAAAIASDTWRAGRVIMQARQILASPAMEVLEAAMEKGVATEVQVAGRTIAYEPQLAASGMTLQSEGGFVLGKTAFSSGSELAKTVLHELYRLATSAAPTSGATAATASSETAAAATFAERAYVAGHALGLF